MAIKNLTKLCSVCRTDKSLSEFPPKSAKCKPCWAEYYREWKEGKREHLADYKKQWYQANKTRTLKEQSSRRQDETLEDKEARKQYHRRYYQEHREEMRAKGKDWYEQNRESIIERNHQQFAENREEINRKRRIHRNANRDRISAASRARRERNKDKLREYMAGYFPTYRARRRAREYNAPINDFTKEDWQELLETFNYHCAYCLRAVPQLVREHVIPLCRGGAHTKSNIIPSCVTCNSRKHAKTLLEFVMANYQLL